MLGRQFHKLHQRFRLQNGIFSTLSSDANPRVTIVREDDGLAIVTLNRPDKMNALDMEM